MKKLLLLLFCANSMFVSGFAMETKTNGYQKLKEDDGLEEKSKDKNLTRLVPWEKMPPSRIARTGKVGKLMKELDSRPKISINDKTVSGIPPLHWLVVSCNWKELKKVLLKYNPNIENTDKAGKTTLFKFLLNHSDDCALGFRYFVYKLNANLKAKDKQGNTLFHEAAMQKNSRLMGELLNAGSDKLKLLRFAGLLAAKNNDNNTALDIAIATGEEKVIQKLRLAIQDIDQKINDWRKKTEIRKLKIDKSVIKIKEACDGINNLVKKMAQLSVDKKDVDSDISDDEYFEFKEDAPIEEDGSFWFL